jgi:hypothetical protein
MNDLETMRKSLREILNQHKPFSVVIFYNFSDFVSRRNLIDDLLAEQSMNDDKILIIMQDILLAGSETSVFNITYINL